jgi:DNA helicase-2/ATP-dependent DNA helicase PcrA
MTMHGAKGLEFSHVFMIGVNEFHIPSARAVSEKQLEEERRLFYVALTRAKKEVTICYAKERNGKPATASRFLKEIKI